MASHPISITENLRPIFAAVRTAPIPLKPGEHPQVPAEPFITIARQGGAGAWTFARQLVEAINAAEPSERPWTCWDRELVEKVAADHNLSQRLIESMENAEHTWLTDFLGSLAFTDRPDAADEAKVYGRVAETIRALARTGRVVIVGRGGVFVTRRMPGGIHLYLVAPEAYRAEFMSKQLHLSPETALAHVRQLEHNRRAFYKRYWPDETVAPETFTLTMNTAALPASAMVEIVRAMLPAMAWR